MELRLTHAPAEYNAVVNGAESGQIGILDFVCVRLQEYGRHYGPMELGPINYLWMPRRIDTSLGGWFAESA